MDNVLKINSNLFIGGLLDKQYYKTEDLERVCYYGLSQNENKPPTLEYFYYIKD